MEKSWLFAVVGTNVNGVSHYVGFTRDLEAARSVKRNAELLGWANLAIFDASFQQVREGASEIIAPFRCTHLVAPGEYCIRIEGHEGEHVPRPAPGAARNCPICGVGFSAIEDFEAHVPCSK
jgi:hypothetical protein